MNTPDGRHKLEKRKRDYRLLLREVSWEEFWKTLDHLVDWNEMRHEIDKLRTNDAEDKP
ncbi:MAG: hypothetical protein GWP61_25110 [Chloroflexi bacterium]|jgi:hypothetical protein|nr:hypothetical protein [Chloroflexota bacterium]